MLLLQPGAFGGRDSGGRGWGKGGQRGAATGEEMWVNPEPYSP